MPSSWSAGGVTHRARVMWNWAYVSLMACGFATILASALLRNEEWIGYGAAAFSLGGLLLALTLFFAHATHAPARGLPSAAPVPARPVSAARGIDFSYEAATPPSRAASNVYPPLGASQAPQGASSAAPQEEDLIEFELVTESEAPTRLSVPPAFQLEQTVDALAEGPIALQPAFQRDDFVPAVARRREIVSGLPILSRVFADEAPAATRVQPRADGKTRGQCGNCGTFLWAPSERPIRLRCPRCGNVKTLTA